jgi:hypothetical protein
MNFIRCNTCFRLNVELPGPSDCLDCVVEKNRQKLNWQYSQYPKCPRCQSDWTENPGQDIKECKLLSCHSCGMDYSCTFLLCARVGEKYIYWNLGERYCQIVSFDKLPWLPFDIKEDKLKLYLTFL